VGGVGPGGVSGLRAAGLSWDRSVARSTITYRSRRPSQEPLRRRLRELAGTRVSYGYKRLHILRCREGWTVNHKRG
jgi:hypothetical protein